MKNTGITSLFVFMAVSLLSQTPDIKGQSATEWQSIDQEQFSIQHPRDWETDQSGQMGTSIILFSPLTSDEDEFRENVNLVIQDLMGYDLSLEQFAEISEGQIKTMIQDGKILTNEKVNEGGDEYQKMVFTGKQGVFNLKFVQHCRIQNNNAYVLTLTCEEEQFENYESTGKKIMDSFKVK